MPNTNFRPFEISTPGSNPYCQWGLKDLVDNDDKLAGYPSSLSPAPVLTCDIVGVSFSDISTNTKTVFIAGEKYWPGTVVTFTLTATDGIAPDSGRMFKEGTITLQAESEAGYEINTDKAVHVGPIQAR